MEKEEITLGIEKILDKWDPIGVLQGVNISYSRGHIGEYTKYVKQIIAIYLSKQSLYDFLVDLQAELWIYPSDEMKVEISLVSKEIDTFLSKYSVEVIESLK